jgi:predicted transposase/invertase (TIGR01784 family)
MNRKFVSKSNYVLRKVLNNEESLDIIKDFIEAVLKVEIKEIILHPYLEKLANYLPAEENFGIVDVRIITKDEEELNVGIQIIDGYYVQNKLLLYYAQIHGNQLEHENQNSIAKTITINILDFNYFSSRDYHKIIKIKENSEYGKISEDFELHTIELKKFNKVKRNIENKEDAWIAYLEGSDKGIKEYCISNYDKIKKLDNLLDDYWKKEKME